LNHLTSIFLTLLFFLAGGNFAAATSKASSAALGNLCNLAVDQEFLTTDRTDKSELGRQGAKNAKVSKPSLEPVFRDSISLHYFSISASLGDLCTLAVTLSSSRITTGSISQIIPTQTQSFTVNDRLTTDTYDANGNTTSSLLTDHGSLGTNASDIYSFDNKLIRRTTPDGKTIDLTYPPDGHRLSKFITQNGLTQRLVHYLTDANNPTGYAQVIEEKQPLDTTSPLKKVNLYGHDLISSEERGTGVSPVSSIFYSYDGLGSVRSISNSTGDLQETYDYDAYGTLIGLAKRNTTTGHLESFNLSSTIPNLQSDYLYTGEQWDADLGMYFLRARYLNTNTGRFHTQDTYEGRNSEPLTLHKYLYANGNPAMFTDPTGNMSISESFLTLGILLQMNVLDSARVMGTIKAIFTGITLYILLADPVGFYGAIEEGVLALGPLGFAEGAAIGLTRTSRASINALKRLAPFLDAEASMAVRYAEFQKMVPQLRRILQAGAGRTVALGQMTIDGEIIGLSSVSGQGGNAVGASLPSNPSFSPFAVPAGTSPRSSDAEYKILESFADYLISTGKRPSKVELWIDHAGGPCASCQKAISDFDKLFSTKVNVISGSN
jgi:RHS repeat-associated protein